MRYPFRTRLDWRKWVVPELLRGRPIHRWFVFPHSFTDDIVRALAEEWRLGKADWLLDPFMGAGTTILAAKQLGISAVGFDLLPLAGLAGRVKVADYDPEVLREVWWQLKRRIRVCEANGESKAYAELVVKALSGKKLATFHAAKTAINELDASEDVKDFFLLALIAQIPRFSNAVPTGGWLSWKPNRRPVGRFPNDFDETICLMLADLDSRPEGGNGTWLVRLADARRLPVKDEMFTAVITSPPYPNRHDYTRVFGVELMFGFLDWDGTRNLRYQMFHSHPEAKPDRPVVEGYKEPACITNAVHTIARNEKRGRLVTMLHGYFLDMFLSAKEVARALKPGGRAAFVLGNAQYDGIPVEVDRAAAVIGEQAGLTCEEIRVVRHRGNSAQQMKMYGRNPSRESVVLFRKG